MTTTPRLFPTTAQPPAWVRKAVFAGGLTLALVVMGWLVIHPYQVMSVPPEMDDAYAYLSRAKHLEECLLRQCVEHGADMLALSREGGQQAWGAYRAGIAGIHIGPPLHPFLLFLLHQTGLAWQEAYQVMALSGITMTVLGMGFLLRHLVGAGAAGIALGLLALQLFPHQGLHYQVPSNFTLALAMWLWLLVLRGLSPLGLLAGIILLISCHPMGQVHGAIAVAFYFIARPPAEWRRHAWMALAGGGVLLLPFAIPRLLAHPLRFVQPILALPIDEQEQGLAGVMANVDATLSLMQRVIMQFGGGALLLPVLLVGVAALVRERRWRPLLATLVLAGAMVVSQFYLFNESPGQLAFRVIIPMLVLLFAIIGAAGWWLLSWAWGVAGHFHTAWPQAAPLAVLSAVFIVASLLHLRQGYWNILQIQQSVSDRYPHLLDVEQPRMAADYFKRHGNAGRILYDLIIWYPFYLTEGTVLAPPVHAEVLPEMRDLGPDLDGYADIRLVVAVHPLIRALGEFSHPHGYRDGGIVVDEAGMTLRLFSARPLTAAELAIRVAQEGRTARTVRIQPVAGRGAGGASAPPARVAGERSLTPGQEVWVGSALPLEVSSREWRIDFPPGKGAARIMGVRSAGWQSTWWPWDQGIALRLEPHGPGQEARAVAFTTAHLPLAAQRPLRVLADRGATLLAEVLPAPAEALPAPAEALPAPAEALPAPAGG